MASISPTEPKVVVRNIPQDFDEDFIKDLFENEEFTGGGEIFNLQLEGGQAVITFENLSVAENVLRKRQITAEGTPLTIHSLSVLTDNKNVLITGIPKTVTETKFKVFFASKRRGGGPIEALEMKPEKQSAIITYKAVEDAQKIVQKKVFDLTGSRVDATFYVPGPEDTLPQRSVYFSGLQADMDQEFLEDIIEQMETDGEPRFESLKFIPEKNAAIAVFEDVNAAQSLISSGTYTGDGISLNMSMYDSTTPIKSASESKKSVRVSHLPKSISKDKLCNFIENRNKSNGGPVDSLKMFGSSDSAIVCFENHEDAERIVESKTVVMKGNQLSFEWYDDQEDETDKQARTDTIIVEGIVDMDEEDLEDIFENEKRCGGGKTLKIDLHDGVAVIKFQDADVAKRVQDKAQLEVDGNILRIRAFTNEPPQTSSQVLITGLQHGSSDKLKNYLENPNRIDGGQVKSSVPGDQSGSYVVEFVRTEDAAKIVSLGEFQVKNDKVKATWYFEQVTKESTVCNEVVVEGLQGKIDDDILEDLFENRQKTGGGNIHSITLSNDKNSAVISFEEESAAKRVLNKEKVTHNGITLHCKPHLTTHNTEMSPSEPTTLEVQNIQANMPKDMVVLYFESKKKSGGGEINDINYNINEGRAIIQFADAKDASDVMKRHKENPLMLTSKVLSIQIFDPEKLGKYAFCVNSCAIEISALPKNAVAEALKEDLTLLFENTNMTGGEETEDVYVADDTSCAVITYHTPQAAENVVTKHTSTPIHLEDQKLHIKTLPCASSIQTLDTEMEDELLLLTNLPEDMMPEEIESNFELIANANIKEIIYGLETGRALIVFECVPDFTAIFQHLRLKPMKGNMVCSERVQQSKMIEVFGIDEPKVISNQKLKIYFEHKPRSNGGEVDKIERDKKNKCAVITFTHVEDAVNVLKKHARPLDKQSITLKLHHRCIGILPGWHDSTMPISTIPIEVSVDIPSEDVMIFIMKSTQLKKDVDLQLEKQHGRVLWTKVSTSSAKLIIKCTLTKNIKGYQSISKSWETNVAAAMHNIFEKIVTTAVSIAPEFNHLIETYIEESLSKDTETVMVVTKLEKGVIHVLGLSNAAEETKDKLQQKLNDIKQAELRKSRMKQSSLDNLEFRKLKFLDMIDFRTTMLKELCDLTVNIDLEKGKITFHGTPEDIDKAQLKMYQVLNGIKSTSDTLSAEKKDIYQRSQTRKYIEKVLESKELSAVFFEIIDDTIVVFGEDDKVVRTGMAVILKCVCDQNLSLPPDSCSVLTSATWKDFKGQMLRKNSELLRIIECSSGVRFICTDDILDDIYNELVNFFKTNTIKELFVPVKSGQVRLLNTSSHLQKIGDKHANHSIKIQAIMDSKTGISFKGTEDGIKLAQQDISVLLMSIQIEKHTVNQPGMPQFFLEERGGKQQLINLENNYNVAIETVEEIDEDFDFEILDALESCVPNRATEIARINVGHGLLVLVIKDDLARHRGDTVLIPATEKLDHVTTTAKLLMEGAGKSIQSECSKHVAQKGCMLSSDVCATRAGPLPYHNMLHAVFPSSQGGVTAKEETELYETFYKCFKAVTKLTLRNLVIPCSILEEYPLDVSTKLLTDAIRDYASKFPNKTLTEIKIIIDSQSSELYMQKMLEILNPGKSYTSPSHGQIQQFATQAFPTSVKTDPFKTAEGIIIKLIKGVIATQKVDVIVNSTSSDLQLGNGVVSNSLLKAGGEILQKECDQYIAKGFKPGMVADTTGGKLQCKRVYHGSCDNWNNGAASSVQTMKDFLKGCLNQGNTSKMTSMALPAIGTGNLGFPRDFVAKTMFEAVKDFSAVNPKTSLKDIRFILYDKDLETVKAFEQEIRNVQPLTVPLLPTGTLGPDVKPKGVKTTRSVRTLTAKTLESKIPKTKTKPKVSPRKKIAGDSSAASVGLIKIGSITIEVRRGDITEEKSDAIVNSTSRDMKFNSQVSKAILNKGGDGIKKECGEIGFMKDYIALTGAGKLKCKHVIHIDAPSYDMATWKVRILQCLKLADNNNLNSISFPALGTGALKISPALMAETIMDATADFSTKEQPKYLRKIRIVIYEKTMVDEFAQELNKIADSALGKKKGFLRKAMDFLGWNQSDVDDISIGATAQAYMPTEDTTSVEEDNDECVTDTLRIAIMHIYGFDDLKIKQVIQEITKICNDECQGMNIDDPKDSERISKLNQNQMTRIKNIESTFPVFITIDRGAKLNRIRIQGRPKNTAQAYVKVMEILSETEKVEARKRDERALHEKVKWQVFDDGKEDYDDYPSDMNFLIEQAYKAQKPFVTWTEKDGDFRIDFKQLQEYPVGDREHGINVRRYAPGDIELPETWDNMDGKTDWTAKDLTPSDLEYEIVIQKFTESMSKGNYLNKVLSIKRIQNPRVYRTYASNKAHVEMANPSIRNFERELWHGTSSEATEEINATGFNRSFCGINGVVWGDGVYFARDATYSHSYARAATDNSRTMYLCKVLTGDFCIGARGLKVPPVKDSTSKRKYDSVVDDKNNPNIFVVFFDSLAYPEFLITYN